MIAALRRLRRDGRGIALVEFAISVPILITLFLGCYEVSDAIACNRKVTITARAVADLISQYKTIAPTDIDTVVAAATQIMAPYDASLATVRVSAMTIDGGSNKGRVTWSRSRGGTALATNSRVDLPSGMIRDSTLILAEVSFPYSTARSVRFMRSTTLAQSIYMVPRVSDTIPCDDC